MNEFEKSARELSTLYNSDTRPEEQKNKDYFSRLCDLFNDCHRDLDASAFLIVETDGPMPGFKVEMPWTFKGDNNLYTETKTNFKDFDSACVYLNNKSQIFKIIKGVMQ